MNLFTQKLLKNRADGTYSTFYIFIKNTVNYPTYSYVNVEPPSPGQKDRIANLRPKIYDIPVAPLGAWGKIGPLAFGRASHARCRPK